MKVHQVFSILCLMAILALLAGCDEKSTSVAGPDNNAGTDAPPPPADDPDDKILPYDPPQENPMDELDQKGGGSGNGNNGGNGGGSGGGGDEQPVPEPSTLVLVGSGLAIITLCRKKKNKA